MVNMNALSPKQLKAAVREATYPNSEVERETIQRADEAANAVVARHARLMETEAVERLEEGASLLRVAAELEKAMTYDVRVQLDRDGDPSALAVTYEQIETGVTKLIAQLRHEAAKAELLADRLSDPDEDYERLIQRLPSLRRAIQW